LRRPGRISAINAGLAEMARILLGPFRLSKIAGEATIARHSGDEIPTIIVLKH